MKRSLNGESANLDVRISPKIVYAIMHENLWCLYYYKHLKNILYKIF